MFFGSIGPPELIIILVIILILFGVGKLPEVGRGLGKGIREFKSASKIGKELEAGELEKEEEKKEEAAKAADAPEKTE